MLPMIILALFGWLQNRFAPDKALIWAIAFGVINITLSALGGGPLLGMVIVFALLTAYAYAYFLLLNHFTDTLLVWFAIFIGGALLPFFLIMMLPHHAA